MIPFDVTSHLIDPMFFQPRPTIRRCRQSLAVALICLATLSLAEPEAKAGDDDGRIILAANDARRDEPDIDMFALMTGKCSTLKVAGRDFACRAVGYFHSEHGRANFTVALDDPADDSHIISFSGSNSRKDDNLYELPIDRMLLNSQNRPKVDGLPVPSVQSSTGLCRQVGNFATARVSSISCSATDEAGRIYELLFESDGSPITVRRIIQSPPSLEKHRLRQNVQLKCRNQADVAKVLPRDLTTYIIRCLAENGQQPAGDDHP